MTNTRNARAAGGFRDHRDYLDQRCAAHKISHRELSLNLKFRPAYINGLYQDRFLPSVERCDQIAKYFGDDPLVVRVLFGLEPTPASPLEVLRRQAIFLLGKLDETQLKNAIEAIKKISVKKS